MQICVCVCVTMGSFRQTAIWFAPGDPGNASRSVPSDEHGFLSFTQHLRTKSPAHSAVYPPRVQARKSLQVAPKLFIPSPLPPSTPHSSIFPSHPLPLLIGGCCWGCATAAWLWKHKNKQTNKTTTKQKKARRRGAFMYHFTEQRGAVSSSQQDN